MKTKACKAKFIAGSFLTSLLLFASVRFFYLKVASQEKRVLVPVDYSLSLHLPGQRAEEAARLADHYQEPGLIIILSNVVLRFQGARPVSIIISLRYQTSVPGQMDGKPVIGPSHRYPSPRCHMVFLKSPKRFQKRAINPGASRPTLALCTLNFHRRSTVPSPTDPTGS